MRRIAETYAIVTSESAEQGDYADQGWIDEDGVEMEPDEYDREEGKAAVDLAVEHLVDQGATEPSSHPWSIGTWYTSQWEQDYRTGDEESRSFHLKEFTPEEEQAIYERVTKS